MIESIFLLPNGTFFVELLVVVLILTVVKVKFLPILNEKIEQRQEKISTSLALADQARAEAAAADDERVKVLAEARDQGRAIVAAAQATADQVKAEASGKGQLEYDRIISSANAEVDTARQRAIDEASARIGELVFELVATIVGKEVDQSAHEELIREAVAALNAESEKGASL